MKSSLQLNVGPALTQTLHDADLITVYYSATDIDSNGNPTPDCA